MKALLVGTPTAVMQEESGASMRARYLKEILIQAGFDVLVCDKNSAKQLMNGNSYSLIVLSSYSCASLGRKARKSTKILWFDPYDSWLTSRWSRIRNREYSQILALLRDVFWISMFPKRELVTFISESDASKHRFFSRHDKLFIIPIHFDSFKIQKTGKIRLVFIGDGSYRPNRDALIFLDEVAKTLSVRVAIIGKDYPQGPKYSRFDYLGYLPSQELFQETDIILAPVKTGAGIKTKVAFPLSLGLRVIAAHRSGNGILDLPNLWKVTSAKDFVCVLREVMNDLSWEYSGPLESIYVKDDVQLLNNYLVELTSVMKFKFRNN
jgi:hypothetical protein